MANARDVVDYFLSKTINDDDAKLTNLKIQKLIYYAQGFHLAIFNTELYQDEIEAWQHGPVCPKIYHDFKQFGSNIIPCDECEKDFSEIFNEDQIELLDEIYDVFGQFSAWKLRDMTHEEPTWMNNKDSASTISHEEMKEYFKTRVA
ncbi:MAG: DUF4065 domain-containing protein [Arcobacteraceae bacterium]|jgi:uncharacterized phage-associated protein|nr:DUF4065 domain-containing protein [Arcobacteraceae bacterium]